LDDDLDDFGRFSERSKIELIPIKIIIQNNLLFPERTRAGFGLITIFLQ
jgi:hypothetical protein